MRSLYEDSRMYSRLGYVTIPCSVQLDGGGSKHARFPDGGYKSRLFDTPSDWEGFDGLAINTAMSGIVVVDIDCGEGKDGFAGLEAAGIELPDTPMQATTQSGGRHLVYRATTIPVEQSSGKLARDVDVRGDASGILYAYPTIVSGGGEYTWDGPAVAVADLPEFPVELARRLAVVRKHRRTPPGDFTPSDVTPAQREWALQKIGYKLRDIAGSIDGSRNDTLGRAVPRIIGLVKTIGEDLDTFTGKITAAYAESGGQDDEQVQGWISSSLSYVQPEDPSMWLPQDRDQSFWDERPELAQIRQAAQSGMASPWAVLGALVVRVLADVPPTFRPLTGVGSPHGGNLNLFSVLAAESGGGKGVATQVAEHLWPSSVHTTEVSSGEALPRLFAKRVKDPETGEWFNEQIRDSVIIGVPEFGSLSASSLRQGATLMQRLCNGFSGESLSFAVADESKNVDVPANSYRLGLIAGIQYGNAGLLLGESAAVTGLPQRFVWFPANIAAEEVPDVRPGMPPSLRQWAFPPGGGVIEVCEEAKREIEAAQRAKLIGDASSPFDGHKLYARVKLAYALAVLNGHYSSVRDEDWELSGIVLRVSDKTRQRAVESLRRRDRKQAEAAGRRDGLRRAAAVETEADELNERVTAGIVRHLSDAGGRLRLSGRDGLRQKMRRQRDHLDDVLADLVSSGRVQTEGDDWLCLT